MTRELFPDSVRPNRGHLTAEDEGEGEQRRMRKMEREQTGAQGAAGGDDGGGGGEKTGGDTREAEGSGDRVLSRTDSSEDEAAADEMTRRTRMRYQGVSPSPDGEDDDGFEDEDEQGVP